MRRCWLTLATTTRSDLSLPIIGTHLCLKIYLSLRIYMLVGEFNDIRLDALITPFLQPLKQSVGADPCQAAFRNILDRVATAQLHAPFEVIIHDLEHLVNACLAVVLSRKECQQAHGASAMKRETGVG